jgi:Alginate export
MRSTHGIVLAVVLACGGPVRGQQPSADAGQAAPPRQQPAVAGPLKIGSLDVSLNWRVRAEGWSWFQGDTGDGTYGFGHSLLRVSIGQSHRSLNWRLEISQAALLGLPDAAVAPAPLGQLGLGGTYYAANGNRTNEASLFPKQAFVRWKSGGSTSLTAGRFEFFDGTEGHAANATLAAVVEGRIAHRLISNFGFTTAQRSFDGAQLSWTRGPRTLTAFGARPTRGVFQADGLGELDIQVYYGSFARAFDAEHGAGSLRVFGIGYIDGRSGVPKTDNRAAADRAADQGGIRIATFGADYVHVAETRAGTFDVLGWGAVQTGSWGALTQRAAALVGEVGWQPPADRLKPWISAGYSYGSGDGNPNDGTHGTFFQLVTTPRQYARFPFYNMMNNDDRYLALNLHPTGALALRSEAHRLRLADAADLWYQGGGAFQSQTFGFAGRPSGGTRSLATTWDLSADYRVNGALSATVYYGRAWGGATIGAIYPGSQTGQFVYLETNIRR